MTAARDKLTTTLSTKGQVILPKAMWHMWLDPTNQNIDVLSKLLVPAPDTLLTMHEVSTDVNNVRNKDASLVEPHESVAQGTLLE